MSQGNLDNATNTRQRSETRRKVVTIALGMLVILGAVWLADQTTFSPVVSESWLHTGHADTKRDAAVTPDSVDAAVIWRRELQSVKIAIASLKEQNQPVNSAVSTQIDVIAQRLQILHAFVEQQESSLPDHFDPNSLLGRELISLRAECETLREYPRHHDRTSIPIPNSHVTVDYSPLSELDARLQQQEQSGRQQVESEAAMLVTPFEEKMRTQIARARLTTRDLEEKRAVIEQQIDVELRERKDAAARTERQQTLKPDMAEVRRLLSPFIAVGHVQPNGALWDRIRTVDAAPVSLSGLEKIGALKPTMDGLEILYKFGGWIGPGQMNDRPLGAFPEYAGNGLHKPYVLESVKRAQHLLRIHGAALVEEKLLSP